MGVTAALCLVEVLILAFRGAAAAADTRQQPALQLAAAAGVPDCPCADPAHCRPVTAVHEREVFGFSVDHSTPYERFDWSQLTTVAWNEDPLLMCAAHAAGARVVLDGRGANAPALYANATARRAWLAGQLRRALDAHLDGINFDLEDPLPPGDPLAAQYTALVTEAAAAFHAAIPGSQVSVDVPWSPHGIDGRNYDWPGLASAADLLFVMAYDMQSQIWGRCIASANSPPALVQLGLRQWLDLGVPAGKLVLGLPWYGYRYPCTNPSFHAGHESLCALPPVPFRGCPCSDAAGVQLPYSDISRAIRRGANGGGDSSGSGGLSSGGGGSSHKDLSGGGSGSWVRQVLPAAAPRPGAGLPAAPAKPGGRSIAGPEGELVCGMPAVDATQGSPYTRCRWASDPPGWRFQVWYDDADSFKVKCQVAAELGLRGVGMWNLDCLDHRCTELACRRETEAMWGALSTFTDGGGPQRRQRQAAAHASHAAALRRHAQLRSSLACF